MVFDARRRVAAESSTVRVGGPELDALFAKFPLVSQFLTLEVYKDGSKRLPGSITLFNDSGTLKGCLNDKDASLSAFVSGDGLAGLLESMERGLAENCLDWREQKPRKGRKG